MTFYKFSVTVQMKNTIELYMSIIIITIFGVLAANMIAINVEANNVRSYQNSCIQAIENSGHDQGVIDQLISDSPYDLSVERIVSDGSVLSKVQVGYHYVIPLLNVNEYYSISGLAR